ncbi:hypothetical protein ScPMuIL_008839 [Solemya velum]
MPLYKVSPSQYAGFLSYFNRLSVNGYMGRQELRAALIKAGVNPTMDEIQCIIDSISVDSRGIKFQGFIDFVSTYSALRDAEQEYAEAFRIFDRKGTGELSKEDIKYVMQKLGIDVDVEKLFKEVDLNNDGFLQYDEFVCLMKKRL